MNKGMNNTQKQPNDASVWVNVDFDTVKQRIDSVTRQINEVLQKHEVDSETGNSKRKN